MCELRLQVENDNILLHCFGASENVYPSGMQIEGGAITAWRTYMGRQASIEDDIVTLLNVASFQRQAIDARFICVAPCATSLNISVRQAHRVGQLAPLPRRNPEDCTRATVGDHAPQGFRG